MSSLFAILINVAIDPVLKIRPGCFVESLNALYYQYSFWNTGPLSIDSVMLALVMSTLSQDTFRPNEICCVCHATIPSTSAIHN